jgi:hypothetical protein
MVQTVMNQWYDWFEQLVEQGRATSGHPLAYQGKIVPGKKGHTVVDGPFVESKEGDRWLFSPFKSKVKRRPSRSPGIARDLNTACRWKSDLSWNSALRARLRVKPPSSRRVGYRLTSSCGTEMEEFVAACIKHRATFTVLAVRAPLHFSNFPCKEIISAAAIIVGQPKNSLTMRLTLCPPKPNELLMATRTFVSRAVLGT